ncbi:phage antirepressor KilAC domain-containing protein [Streptosporangium sp. NBC_01755]|uniref:phage antirepressor KilAC domain-containing protein n=1 Tax=Streptosporangium sp. NBC_01755 TaxID=2975949 RepID=UPI002DD80DFC|nr:phage antirepressor KilAC domain-containing protein [Streptosporangium sp. NBC_01755]WSD01458.1 phage antirepressor KilAC domain-containing protein [Streptosporangium sp. NBC_01755]
MHHGTSYGPEDNNRGSQQELQLPVLGESSFDAIRRLDEQGEYWTGRDLQPLMDYVRWEKFAEVIEKAKASLALVKGADQANHHFAVWGSDGGRWGNQKLDDFRLTRFGAYLTAMAGDDTKEAVARARIYFAAQTRKQELAEQAALVPGPRSSMDLDSIDELERLNRAFGQAIAIAKHATARAEVAEARADEFESGHAQAELYASADGLTAKRAFARDVQQWCAPRKIKVTQQQVFNFLGHIGLIIRSAGSEHDQATAQAIKDLRAENATKKVEMPDGTILKVKYGKLTSKGEKYAWDRIYKAIGEHGTLDLDVIKGVVVVR